MAQKYLSSYGIWVNTEEGDVLSEQQLDNVDGYSSLDITQLTPDGDISQDTVASEEETLEETQEVLEDLHDENEQKIEELPEEVTEEVVQASNETFLLCLGRLGFGTKDINKLKLGFESYNTPISNLRTTNRAIKNVLKEIKKHKRLSKEYNALDWPKFLLGFGNTIWRALFNNSTTSIEKPGILIELFLGKWTTVGQIISNYNIYDIAKTVCDYLKGRGNIPLDNSSVKLLNYNIYKDLIVNYKKNNDSSYDSLVNEFNTFKGVISYIKSNICKKINPRPCSTTEISQLKVFRPNEIQKEISQALSFYKNNGYEKLINLTNDVATYITNDIIKFLENNISADV